MDDNRPDSSAADDMDSFEPSQPPPGYQQDSVRVLAVFLLYSMMMFSVPFLAFFGTRHFLKSIFHIEGFANTAWSVVAAVVVINVIILMYACTGYDEEKAEDADKKKEPENTDSKKTKEWFQTSSNVEEQHIDDYCDADLLGNETSVNHDSFSQNSCLSPSPSLGISSVSQRSDSKRRCSSELHSCS